MAREAPIPGRVRKFPAFGGTSAAVGVLQWLVMHARSQAESPPERASAASDGSIVVNLVALLALASGVLNLYSVARPFSPMRVAEIERLLPGGLVVRYLESRDRL